MLSIVVIGCSDSLGLHCTLRSLLASYQIGVSEDQFEVIVVVPQDAMSVVGEIVARLKAPFQVRTSGREDVDDADVDSVASQLNGELITILSAPCLLTPRLLRTAIDASTAYPGARIIWRCFGMHRNRSMLETFAEAGTSDHGYFILGMSLENPDSRLAGWLDPVDTKTAGFRARAATAAGENDVRAVSLIGEALITLDGERIEARPTARSCAFFGSLGFGRESDGPPRRAPRRPSPRLSVVVVVHEMRREAVRTLQSLRADYQLDMRPDDYEVLVIENGSREPLDAASVEALGPNVKYRYLENAPASPARAINVGVSQSSGEVIAIMIDGACLLSPGVLSTAMRAYACFERPVVLTRYFYLGPGRQNDTIPGGYNRKVEDALLASIRWPEDPYRLFEIASPLTVEGPRENWFTPWFESNCLFMPRDLFEEIGGCEERFDLPGGGAANIDLFARAGSHEESHLVQLIGEGVFHQVHGGITTNVSPAARDEMIRDATAQYERIRGNVEPVCRKRVHYIGQLAVAAARSKMDG